LTTASTMDADTISTSIFTRFHEAAENAGQPWNDITTRCRTFWDGKTGQGWFEKMRSTLKELSMTILRVKPSMTPTTSLVKILSLVLLLTGAIPVLTFVMFAFTSASLALASLLFLEGMLFAVITSVLIGLILSSICIMCTVMMVGAGLYCGPGPINRFLSNSEPISCVTVKELKELENEQPIVSVEASSVSAEIETRVEQISTVSKRSSLSRSLTPVRCKELRKNNLALKKSPVLLTKKTTQFQSPTTNEKFSVISVVSYNTNTL